MCLSGFYAQGKNLIFSAAFKYQGLIFIVNISHLVNDVGQAKKDIILKYQGFVLGYCESNRPCLCLLCIFIICKIKQLLSCYTEQSIINRLRYTCCYR